MASAHPPAIAVRQTTKSMYRPISKLNGDQLPMLRRVKRPELSGRISLYNQYTERVLDTALNVSFRQHEHTMETIRKEQAQIYKSLCRIQKQKRRVQKDEHEQRRQEIRNLFNRQRKRHNMMRRVVAKFKENVIKKRAERMIQAAASESHDDYKAPVLSANQLMKYAGGLRRQTQPNTTADGEDQQAATDNGNNTNSDQDAVSSMNQNQGEKSVKPAIGDKHPSQNTDEDSNKNETEVKLQKSLPRKQTHNRAKKNLKLTASARKRSKTDGQLEAIPEVTMTRAKSKTGVGKMKDSSSASREKLKSKLSSQSLPSINLSMERNGSHGYSEEVGHLTESLELKEEHNISHDSLIDQVVKENTFSEDDPSGRVTRYSVRSEIFERDSDSEQEDEEDECENAYHATSEEDARTARSKSKGKGHRANMVKVIEKERAVRAKARTRILDEEPFTRYSRKRQEKISAMYGLPKKLEFVPPSGKLRHEQEKLIRKEQDKDIQYHMNIEKFFQEVFQSKETAVYRQPTVEKEDAPKKPTLSLASVLSQMYSSAEPVQGDKNSMENLKGCQYLRVYNPYRKKVIKERSARQESSWDVAERKLRAGFMALSFMK